MKNANDNQFSKRVQPIKAGRALAGFLANKEATSEIFKMLNALDGPIYERNFQRYCLSETGRKVLTEKRDICATLSDRDALRKLPEGSLGRAYLDFVESEGLSAEGFQREMESSGEDLSTIDDARRLYLYRSRHTHDLFHILTGYGRDFVGELGLLGFTYQQSGVRTFAIMLQFSILKARKDFPTLPVRDIVREGHRLGKAAGQLLQADWESLLAQPVEKIRADLNIGQPTLYLSVKEESARLDKEYRENQEKASAPIPSEDCESESLAA